MLLAEELALVAVDPATGRHALGTRSHLNATLAALLVCELMMEGYATAGPRRATVLPAGERRPPSDLLVAAADVVAERGPKVKGVLSHMSRGIEKRLGYGTWEAALVGLAEAGVLAPAGAGCGRGASCSTLVPARRWSPASRRPPPMTGPWRWGPRWSST
jgi:hypothetical protein